MSKLKQSLLTIAIGFALIAGISYAWTGPTANPPLKNAPAPINVGPITQVKSGSLGVDGFSALSKAIFYSTVQIKGGAPAVGKVLTSDADGNASWGNAGGGVGGSGTVNYVSKWVSASSLGNSKIFDDGTSVGIGTNKPSATLHVKAGNGDSDPWAFRMEQGTSIKPGMVLTSADSSGNAQWEVPKTGGGGGAYVSGGLYGFFEILSVEYGSACFSAKPPANFDHQCGCPAGFTRVVFSTSSGGGTVGSGACYKN